MRDFFTRLLEARRRESDPILDHQRQRNTELINNAYPGGVAKYLEDNPPATTTPKARATSTPPVNEMAEYRRERNRKLLDNAYPGGADAYFEADKASREADPEQYQMLFGNPYVNLFNRLFNR